METTIRKIGEQVVAALTAAGYAELTIGEYRKWIRWLEVLGRKQGGVYTPGLGAEFASLTTSPRTGKFSGQRCRDYSRLIAVFDSYVLTGQVDLSVTKRGSGRVVPQSQEFAALLAAWSVEIQERDLAAETSNAYNRVACDYLCYLETNAMTSLEVAEASSVLGFLESTRGRWSENSLRTGITNFRAFLGFCQRHDLVDALNMIRTKRHHDVVPLLTRSEEHDVVQTCSGDTISARDAAITLLALVTGLRACDLIALRVQDIDWRTMTIEIVQQKTGNPLRLPLPPTIADKLAQYLLSQRPDSGDEHVFLRMIAPYTKLSDHASIYAVISRVFEAAGVARIRVGSRLLRHNAATKLLRAGTPLPTISAVLGHASPDSTKVYLSTHTQQMRACVLPLPLASQQGARP